MQYQADWILRQSQTPLDWGFGVSYSQSTDTRDGSGYNHRYYRKAPKQDPDQHDARFVPRPQLAPINGSLEIYLNNMALNVYER